MFRTDLQPKAAWLTVFVVGQGLDRAQQILPGGSAGAWAGRCPRQRWTGAGRASFGWLAEREPEMVRAIATAGHEIASHGQEHELVERLGPDGFRASVRRSRASLEDISGQPVKGYRAPSFSIVPGLEWAFDVLLEEGYRYDASLFPVSRHPTYGYPDAEVDPHWIHRPSGRLAEFPATTARLFGRT